MSDTEEEVSFASADEGEGEDKIAKTPPKNSPSSGSTKKVTEKADDGQGDKKEPMTVIQGKKGGQKKKEKQPEKTKGQGEPEKMVGTSNSVSVRKPVQGNKKSSGAKSSVTSQEKQKPETKGTVEETGEESAKLVGGTASLFGGETGGESTMLAADTASPYGGDTELNKPAYKTEKAKTEKDLSKSERVQESVILQNEQVGESGNVSSETELMSSPAGQDIPREQPDHTPEQEDILRKLGGSTEKQKQGEGGWGWSSWGSSLLSAATNSVQTFTHQVGDGFSTIMETVESSLGVPDPEEILKAQSVRGDTTNSSEDVAAKTEKEEEKGELNSPSSEIEVVKTGKNNDEEKEKASSSKGEGWFSGWSVTDLAKKVQDTGKSLATKGQSLMSEGFDAVENLAAGGIDILESIGKKTYDTLSENDPAFRKTRQFLSPKSDKPNLSSVLREARDKAEQDAKLARENEEARKAHFGTLFDDYQGIAHLEALEMLSNQSEKKVHSLLNVLASTDLAEIKPTLVSIKEAFQVPEDDDVTVKEQDFSSVVSQCVSELELGTAPDKLNKVHEMVKQWIIDFDSQESHKSDSTKEVHQKGIQALAELTAKGVEQFHKAGELVLLERDKDKDCTERAHSLARLTGVLCHEISNLASKFVEILNKMGAESELGDEVTPLVTNIYLEATNSSTYIQDAFQLLLPVLQHAALEHSILSRQS